MIIFFFQIQSFFFSGGKPANIHAVHFGKQKKKPSKTNNTNNYTNNTRTHNWYANTHHKHQFTNQTHYISVAPSSTSVELQVAQTSHFFGRTFVALSSHFECATRRTFDQKSATAIQPFSATFKFDKVLRDEATNRRTFGRTLLRT